MLVLLTLIAVALLSLASISSRGSSLDAAEQRARANARMALMMAIGELQQFSGPDTRVTATADIVDPSYPPVLGVWRSWGGSDHEGSGRPIAPDYIAKDKSEAEGGRFVGYLVSSASMHGTIEPTDAPYLVQGSPSSDTVPLLAGGSLLPDDARQVHVVPTENENGGSYAWWISGENQKARLPVPYKPADSNDAAAWSVLAKTHAVADPSMLELDSLLEPDGAAKAAKAFSLRTSTLLSPATPQNPEPTDPAKQFHDLSASAVGLLTNTATGGWRKDLSLFTENWDNLPASGVEVFRITSADASLAPVLATMTRPTESTEATAKAPGSVFYPWSTYRTPIDAIDRANNHVAAVASWHNLMDYATLYKLLTLESGTGKPVIAAKTDGYFKLHDQVPNPKPTFEQNLFRYLHKTRVVPVLGQVQMVFSYRALPIDPADPATKYKVQMSIAPYFTFWNPYNVSVDTMKQYITFPRPLPLALRFRIGSHYDATKYFIFAKGGGGTYLNANRNYVDSDGGTRTNWTNLGNDALGFMVNIPKLGAGETMVQSATNTVLGYRYDLLGNHAGLTNSVININAVGEFDKTDLINIDARFDAVSEPANASLGLKASVGLFQERSRQFTTAGQRPFMGHTLLFYEVDMANTVHPHMDQDEFPERSVESIIQTLPELASPISTCQFTPFMSFIYGPRHTSTNGLPSRGFQQYNPLLQSAFSGRYVEIGSRDAMNVRGQTFAGGVLGAANPVNSPMDYTFYLHSDMDSLFPNASLNGNRGYVLTGMDAQNGLSRAAVAEIPLRPLCSLGELQHWDMRYDNPAAPYQFNIIANSDALPLFKPDAVVRQASEIVTTTPAHSPALDSQHDDSYCANHILFDDWFFSSIAPQPTTFGPIGKTLQQTYEAFVRDGTPLDNRAYRPVLEDRGITAAQAMDLYTNKVNTAEGYRTIASRLEVEGMFNVNSTSEKAWRALLGHARNQRMPYYDTSGALVLSASTPSTDTSVNVPRTTLAGDVKAGTVSSTNKFADATEFSGYRVFTDAMLDELAKEVVREVRERGPFLSLSEFVNRKLTAESSEEKLALAGAVQSALNVLAEKEADLNPFKVIQDSPRSQHVGKSVLGPLGMDVGSGFDNFPEASEGESAYGLPGWPRQADILRPLAPILTARDDTFTIRAYGDARDARGNVTARATCEAVVRRARDFVSAGEDAADTTGKFNSATNERFGRRYELISFRWLNANEV